MNVQQFFQSISERLQGTASVKSVYGDPVTIEGRTIIPVMKVGYGFGGGTGAAPAPGERESTEIVEGGGGGGGVMATPMGVVEVTKEGTRYIPFTWTRKMATAVGAGFVLGVWMGRKRKKDKDKKKH